MIRTVVADDHELVRKGIVTLLQNTDDIQVIGEAADGTQAIKLVEDLRPAVIVMDISMPRLDGIQAAERLTHNGTSVIILSMHDHNTLVRRAFAAGVRGYVLKNSVTEELLLAIRTAVRGGVYLSPSISSVDLEVGFLKANPVNNQLSAREKEVLQLIAEGNTNNQIGETLHISGRTVEKHRKNCMNKLNVKDLPSLILEAIKQRLIIIDPLD